MDATRELEQMLIGFRDQYGEVYVTEIGDEEYVFRTISPKEYRELVEFAQNEDDAFERVCNTAVLWPRIDFSQGKAYLPTMLAPMILEESGFGGSHKEIELLMEYRRMMSSFNAQAPVIIATAFPQYRLEEIETWTKEKIIKFATMAEWQFRVIRGVQNFSLISPLDRPEGEEGDEEPEEQKPLDLMEQANELRKQGLDPMFVLGDMIRKPKEAFMERPIVGGTAQMDGIIAGVDAWKKGALHNGRYSIVQQQVQKVSGGRIGYVPEGRDTDDD